jgi:hypothetical protein
VSPEIGSIEEGLDSSIISPGPLLSWNMAEPAPGMNLLAYMMPVSLGTLAASPLKWAATASCWAVYGSIVRFPPLVSMAVTRQRKGHSKDISHAHAGPLHSYEEDINVPLLLTHVLLTSSADLHASPEQAFNAARRSLRYAGLAPSSIRLLSW